ncbi:MAG: hypothetical protein MRECE_16c027 [Mycoplasmataceae bacterium CE_OT135]|nr:MAG: hypothetical protein MRECE_16c027 [Mycoplasmataceae bacterium CE_OT135]
MTLTLEQAYQILGINWYESFEEINRKIQQNLNLATRNLRGASLENKEEARKKYNEVFQACTKIRDSGYQRAKCERERCGKIFPLALVVDLYMGWGRGSKKLCSVECRTAMLEELYYIDYQEVEEQQNLILTLVQPSSQVQPSSHLTILCRKCGKNSSTGVGYQGKAEVFCSMECLDAYYYKCEKCGNSSVHYKDGKTITCCLVNGQKLCLPCSSEIITSANVNNINSKKGCVQNHHPDSYKNGKCLVCEWVEELKKESKKFERKNEQEKFPNSSTYTTQLSSSPNIEPEPHQENTKVNQINLEKSPNNNNSELDLYKEIYRKEIEQLLANNPQISIKEKDWKENWRNQMIFNLLQNMLPK